MALITNADPSGINGSGGPGGCKVTVGIVISGMLVVPVAVTAMWNWFVLGHFRQ